MQCPQTVILLVQARFAVETLSLPLSVDTAQLRGEGLEAAQNVLARAEQPGGEALRAEFVQNLKTQLTAAEQV